MLGRALYDVWLVVFWAFVAWCGGPLHHSYGHAKLQGWLAQLRLRQFLKGEGA